LAGIGVNLNVNIYDNGYGTVAQGSFYPDIELSESQDCVTDLQIFAVDENFTWELGTESTFSNSNVLGMDNGLLCEGDNLNTLAVECDDNTDEAWGFGLVTGLFDATPSTPVPTKVPPGLPFVALTDGTVLGLSCGAWCAGPNGNDGGAASPQLPFDGDIAACTATCDTWDYATSSAYSGGVAPGYLSGTGTSSMFNVNAGNSAMCDGDWTQGCNPDVDFKLVWNALDSEETGLGFGDDPDVDEDGDGSDFDRIFGVPYLGSTSLNATVPGCDITGGTAQGNPFNYALAGDIVSTLGDAGCDDDDATTPCCSELFDTVSGVYDCGESVVAAFMSDNCFGSVLAGVEAGCLAQTAGGVVAACTQAGGVANTVYGGCAQQASGEVLTACNGAVAATTAAGGDDAAIDAALAAVIEGACISAGGPAISDPDVAGGITCGDLAASYAAQSAGDCTVAVGLATSTESTSLCMLAGAIGASDYPTCTDFAGSYSDDALNALALDATGADCPTTATALANGYALSDATTIATLNGMATAVLGQSCTDFGNGFTSTCLETDGLPNSVNETEVYLLNPAAVPATYGFFVTYNGTVFSSIAAQAATGPIPCGDAGLVAFDGSDLNQDGEVDEDDIVAFTAGCNPHLMVNDSDHDFDPSCLYDQDPSDCSGRLRLTFEPTCVPEIEARQIVAEFVDLTALCDHSGDVDYSCDAYDWNYNFLADTGMDGIDAADCEAFATATGQAYVVNNGAVLQSCDADEGITSNCSDLSATVVWNAAYGMCGDGDPNDLIDLGVDGFCALAVPTGSFGDPSSPAALPTCQGFYAQQGGVPSFEQSCEVGDGTVSVTDVVRIINHIIGNDSTGGNSVDQLGGEAACAADVNNDGNINVVDVVQVVNGILAGQGGRVADASEASLIIDNDRIIVDADGYIGAVDMIVEFTDNSSFELADGFASSYSVNGNKAHIILVGDRNGISEVLTMTSGKIVSIEEALVANSSDFVTTSINQPSLFSVGAAYPNPFNPSTNISLVLNANADLSVKVYNLTGQLVDVIAEGNYSPSSYNWTWKADNLASGVYFIKTQVGSDVNTQKVMLLK
jgi:hypothetical protein